MKSTLIRTALLTMLGLVLLGSTAGVAAEDMNQAIEAVRATYRTDRHTFVAEKLPLTAREAEAFWPLYREYRTKIEKLGDDLVKLVLEYADVYPDVPEDRAQRMLKQYTALERKMAGTRATYFKRAAKSISPVKALRWAQLENRMDLALRHQLAGLLPSVPTP